MGNGRAGAGRRVWMTVSFGVLLAAAVAGAEAQETGDAFRGGGPNTGVIETRGVERLGGLAWRFQTGGTIRSSPSVADGTVYVGSGDGRLYALDGDTGALLWSQSVGAPVGGAPLVTGDRVVFTDRANRVHAVERATGDPIWSVETGPDLPLTWGLEGWDYLLPSPARAGRRVLVGSGDGSLYALELESGREVWRFRTGGRIRGTPAVHDGIAWVGSGDGIIYAVSVEDGREIRRHVTAGTEMDATDFGFDRTQIQASAAVAGGTVYLGSRDASLYALDPTDATVRWTAEEGSAWVVASVAVRDGRVFVGRSSSGTLAALDAATGEVGWTVATGGPVFSSPVVVGETVYVASGGGDVLALAVEDGAERWRYPLGAGSYSTPAVRDGRIYVGSDDGHLYALRAAEGPAPRMAVYWDDDMMEESLVGRVEAHREMAGHFQSRGYEALDTTGLIAFLEERIQDRTPSAVVFAMDGLPGAVRGTPDGGVPLLRRYLDAGGKVVWLGMPPDVMERNEEGAFTGIDRDRPSRLLDVDLRAWNTDVYGVTPTPEGRRWGLENSWVGEPWMAQAGEGVTPLAVDEVGQVSAWVKAYGGPPGTGFVAVRGSTRWDRLEGIRLVAEYGVLRDPVEASR